MRFAWMAFAVSSLLACAVDGDKDSSESTAKSDVLPFACNDPNIKPTPPASAATFTAPPAPDGAASTAAGDDKGPVSSFAASPTISPSDSAPGADYELVPPGGPYSCAGGTLCTGVWDPNAARWKIFKLYFCTTYSLNNWFGSGFYLDNQTPGTWTSYYGQFRNELSRFTPDCNQHAYNWAPVWFIKNC